MCGETASAMQEVGAMSELVRQVYPDAERWQERAGQPCREQVKSTDAVRNVSTSEFKASLHSLMGTSPDSSV